MNIKIRTIEMEGDAEQYGRGQLTGTYGRMEFAICLGKAEMWSKMTIKHEEMAAIYAILVPVIRKHIQEELEIVDNARD